MRRVKTRGGGSKKYSRKTNVRENEKSREVNKKWIKKEGPKDKTSGEKRKKNQLF